MKKYIVWIIVTIILVILALGFGYYMASGKLSIFSKESKDSNNRIQENNNKDKKKDELKEVSFNEVKYLYDGINVYNESCAPYYNYYYQNNELKIDDMSDDFKISLALYRAYVAKEIKDDGLSGFGNGIYITRETLNKYFYNIFSSDEGYDTNNIKEGGGFKAGYPFVFEDNKFYWPAMGCQSMVKVYKKVINTKKSNKKVEIYEKMAYLVRDEFPNSAGKIKAVVDSDSSLGTFDDIDKVNDDTMQQYLDKLSTYKYTFEYIDKDKAYKFVKVEKVQ